MDLRRAQRERAEGERVPEMMIGAVITTASVAKTTRKGATLTITWTAERGLFASDLATYVETIEFEPDATSSKEAWKQLRMMARASGMPEDDVAKIRHGADLKTLACTLEGARVALKFLDDGPVLYRSASEAEEAASKPAASRGSFHFEFGSTLAEPQPPVVWLCRDLGIVKGRPTVISGYAGSIKTWLAFALALAVAAGHSTMWGGVPIQLAGTVRIIDYENLGEVSARRLQRMARGMGLDLAKLGDKIGRVALPGVYLTDAAAAEGALRAACTGVAVCIIDSLRAACPDEDENSSTIRKYLDLLTRVTQATGCIFVVIHHEGKAPTNGDARRTVERMRGSSGIADAVDCSISVSPRDDETYEIAQGKHSWGKAGEPLAVRLADVGDEDVQSRLSAGIRVEQVSGAERASREDPHQRVIDRIRQILNLTRNEPLGYKELCLKIGGRRQVATQAIGVMVERGELAQDADTKRYALPPAKQGVPGVPADSEVPAPSGDMPDRLGKQGFPGVPRGSRNPVRAGVPTLKGGEPGNPASARGPAARRRRRTTTAEGSTANE